MNKYLTFPGMQPVYLGDIDFMQESVRSAFTMLLKGLTGQEEPNCILVNPTSDKDGVICYKGEILPLKTTSGQTVGAFQYTLKIIASGERTFKSGDVNKCYEERYVERSVVTGGGEYIAPLSQYLAHLIGVSSTSGDAVYSEGNIDVRLAYSKIGSYYNIRGQIEASAEGTYANILTSSDSNFPAGTWRFPITFEDGSGMKVIPAKLLVQYDAGVGYNKMTLTITQTKLSAGAVGSFSFMM